MIFKNKCKKILNYIKQSLFVDCFTCISCGQEMHSKSRHGLCDSCYSKMSFIEEDYCHKCGRIQHNEADYCLTCQNNKRYFDRAISSCVYEGNAKKLI